MAQAVTRKTLLLLDLSSRLAKYIEGELRPERVSLQNLYSNVAPFVGDPVFVHTLIEEFLLPHFDTETREFDTEGLTAMVPPNFTEELGEAAEDIPAEVQEKMSNYFRALCDVYTAI